MPQLHTLTVEPQDFPAQAALQAFEHVVRDLNIGLNHEWETIADLLRRHRNEPAAAAADLAAQHAAPGHRILTRRGTPLDETALKELLAEQIKQNIAEHWSSAFEDEAANMLALAVAALPRPPWPLICYHLAEIHQAADRSWADQIAAQRAAIAFAVDALREQYLPVQPLGKGGISRAEHSHVIARFNDLRDRHDALVHGLRALFSNDYDHTYMYHEGVDDLLENEPEYETYHNERSPGRRAGEALTFHLFGDGEEWFVRVADPEDADEPRRVTVYYQQPGDAARYIVADSRDTGLLAQPQPHRAGFIKELAELLAAADPTADSGADFIQAVYALLVRHGHTDLYDAAYDRAHPDESLPAADESDGDGNAA